MSVPFLRQYPQTQKSITEVGGFKSGQWVPVFVQFILPLKGVRLWRQTSLPCYKVLVKTEYQKELGSVIESLQSKVVADVPEEPLAAGVGRVTLWTR